MKFMDCMADACASGACDCHDDIFEHACGGMVDACPSVGVQCNSKRATCLAQPMLNNETVKEILADLVGMKARKCKLSEAVAAGFVNADNRLRELEPPIQGRLDLLKIKGVKEEDLPSMECGSELKVVVEAKPKKDTVLLALRKVAQVPMTPMAHFTLEGADNKMSEEKRAWIMAIICIVNMLIVLLCALIYNGYRKTMDFKQKSTNDLKDGNFKNGLFSCFEDMKISVLACCCLPLRWSDTLDKANKDGNTLNYWPAICISVGLTTIYSFISYVALYPMVACLASIIFIALAIKYRQSIRKQYGLKQGGGTVAEDCLAWTCCSCCAAVQEAREIESLR